jgi:hypothetical protein
MSQMCEAPPMRHPSSQARTHTRILIHVTWVPTQHAHPTHPLTHSHPRHHTLDTW